LKISWKKTKIFFGKKGTNPIFATALQETTCKQNGEVAEWLKAAPC